MNEAKQLLRALGAGMGPEERLILCGFFGDPNTAPSTAWRPRPWTEGREVTLPEGWNAYVTVASFGRAGDGSFRRRIETFRAGRALMVDDVGTKVERSVVEGMSPTFRIETSPGNEQWWYLLDEPCRDAATFDGVIRAFISGKLLGADPGMAGVNRVGRLPGFQNAKPKYGGWRVRTLAADGPRYSIEELLAGFGLKINGRRVSSPHLTSDEARVRNSLFAAAFKWLDVHRMLKRDEPDPSGWTEMRCPWIGDHTDKADTGAALREPSPENDYYGAFRCHHGHCADKGWSELTEWISEQSEDAAASRNEAGSLDFESTLERKETES